MGRLSATKERNRNRRGGSSKECKAKNTTADRSAPVDDKPQKEEDFEAVDVFAASCDIDCCLLWLRKKDPLELHSGDSVEVIRTLDDHVLESLLQSLSSPREVGIAVIASAIVVAICEKPDFFGKSDSFGLARGQLARAIRRPNLNGAMHFLADAYACLCEEHSPSGSYHELMVETNQLMKVMLRNGDKAAAETIESWLK